MTMAGGHLIVLSTYLQLAPKWIVSSALLVAGAVDAEKQYRIALASALMVSLSLEMAWTWFFPEALSHRAAGGCLALSTLFQGLAASTSLGGGASPTATFALLAAAGCACIPVNQLGALWRLGQPSAARYRIAGWIMAVSLGSLALLWRSLGAAPALLWRLRCSGAAVALLWRYSGAALAFAAAAVAML